jgi:hypothetical protein
METAASFIMLACDATCEGCVEPEKRPKPLRLFSMS